MIKPSSSLKTLMVMAGVVTQWETVKRQIGKNTTCPKASGHPTENEDRWILFPYVTAADHLISKPQTVIYCHHSLHSSGKVFFTRLWSLAARIYSHSDKGALARPNLDLRWYVWISVGWVFLTELTECKGGAVTLEQDRAGENFQGKCIHLIFELKSNLTSSKSYFKKALPISNVLLIEIIDCSLKKTQMFEFKSKQTIHILTKTTHYHEYWLITWISIWDHLIFQHHSN